jgi:hypothetical protein
MLQVVSNGLWRDIKRLARANKPRFAAIAYVTSDALIKFGRGDTLVCDATDGAIKSGQTCAAVLRAALKLKRGASLYSSPGLHAKVLLLGRTSVIGSANMSASSADTLVEASVLTDDARAAAGVRVLVERLAKDADRIDHEFLDRIAKLEVRAPRRGSARRRPVTVPVSRAWLVSVVPFDDGRYESEDGLVEAEKKKAQTAAKFSDSDAGYIRWTGNSLFRRHARPGDLVVAMWRPHSNSARGTVFAPEPLLHRKDKGNVTHFFVEEYGDRDKRAIPFSTFAKIWRRAAAGRTPQLTATRELRSDLIETLRQLWTR